MLCAAAAILAAPASAEAAAKPVVRTGAAANIGQTTATLIGTVNPKRLRTTYYFQLGPTRAYGAATAAVALPARRRAIRVVADVGAMAPATRYHYRIVAVNARGESRGRDRTFTTARQPLGLTLAASPNPVIAGRATVVSGTLSGTGNAGRHVVLQANPFPYTSGFLPAANIQLTDASGNFSFPVLGVPVTTQYRVYLENTPEVASPIVVVGAAVRVSTRIERRRARRGVSVRFAGRIRPARDGVAVEVQRLQRDGQWRTRKRTVARHARAGFSRYSTRVRIRRRGTFRVFVASDGPYAQNVGRTIRVRVRR